MFSEFYCLGGWEEFIPSLAIEPSYNEFSSYYSFEVSMYTFSLKKKSLRLPSFAKMYFSAYKPILFFLVWLRSQNSDFVYEKTKIIRVTFKIMGQEFHFDSLRQCSVHWFFSGGFLRKLDSNFFQTILHHILILFFSTIFRNQ